MTKKIQNFDRRQHFYLFIYLLIKNYVSLFPGGSTRKVTTVADSGRRTDYSNCKAVTKKRNHYCKNESHVNNLRVGPFVFKNCNKKILTVKKYLFTVILF